MKERKKMERRHFKGYGNKRVKIQDAEDRWLWKMSKEIWQLAIIRDREFILR